MTQRPTEAPVRIIGSRELHHNLTGIMRELEQTDIQFILTVHGKPKAVLVGAEACLNYLRTVPAAGDSPLGLQLSALLGRPIEEPQPPHP